MVSVTVIGGVSEEASRSLEVGFRAFEEQMTLAADAQEQMTKALEENFMKHSKEKDNLIVVLNSRLHVLMDKAKEKEIIVNESLKAMADAHQNTKESLYKAGLEKATELANQLAYRQRIHKGLEEEMKKSFVYMNDHIKLLTTNFEQTTDQIMQNQKTELSDYKKQFKHVLKTQEEAHQKQLSAMRKQLKQTNEGWEQIVKQVTSAFEKELAQVKASVNDVTNVAGIDKDHIEKVKKHHAKVIQSMIQSQNKSNEKWGKLVNETVVKNKMLADRLVEEGHRNLDFHRQKQQVKFDDLIKKHDQEMKDLKAELTKTRGHLFADDVKDKEDDVEDNDDDSEDFIDFEIESRTADEDKDEDDVLNEWIEEMDLQDQLMETKPYLDVQAQSVPVESFESVSASEKGNSSLALPIWSIALIAVGGLVVFLLLIIGMYKCHQRRARRRPQTNAPHASISLPNDMIVLTDSDSETLKSPDLLCSAKV